MKKKSHLPVPTSKKTTALSLRKHAIIGTIAIATLTLSVISESRLAKKNFEIWKIRIENKFPVCEQYALKARKAQYFPCHECPNGKIYLQKHEVWRYGFAGMGGEKKRYPSKYFYKEGKWGLTRRHLYYETPIKGNSSRMFNGRNYKNYSLS